MNGLEIIDIIEKSDRLPVMSSEITNIINMISDYDTINIEDLAEKIASCGNLRESLLKEKFTNSEIDKIFYKNVKRVIKECL